MAGVEQSFERADGEITQRGGANGLALSHLQIARQFVQQDQDRLVTQNGYPFVDPWRLAPLRQNGAMTSLRPSCSAM